MVNTIDVIEEALDVWQEDTFIISAYVSKIGKHTPHDAPDDEHVFQYTICIGIPRPNSMEVYRHGSNTFLNYDDAVLTMNEYLRNFYGHKK